MNRRNFAKTIALASAASLWHEYDSTLLSPVDSDLWGSQLFDVTRFGARGDGISDDSAAFVAALAAAGARGGIVTVPPGKYPISRTLHLASEVVLQGSGPASAIHAVDGDPLVIVSMGTQRTAVQDLTIAGRFAHGILLEHAVGARVARCCISGGTIPRAGYSGGVMIVGCVGVTVEHCRFQGHGGDGYQQGADIQCDGLGATSTGIHLLDNECSSEDVAMNIRCHDLSHSEIRRNSVRGARIHGSANHGYGILIYATGPNPQSCHDNVIADNHVSHTQGSGIYLAHCDQSFVTGNLIEDVASVQADDVLPVAAIALNRSQYVTIANNRILNSGRAGISIASNQPGVGHVEIRQNDITNVRGYGIHLRGTLRSIRIVANTLAYANGGIGGDTTDAQDEILIADNVISSVAMRPAIRLGNAGTSTVVRNTVRNAANYGLDLTFRDAASTADHNIVEHVGTTLGVPGAANRIVRADVPRD